MYDDTKDRPTQSMDNMTVEALNDELRALDGGIAELTERRRMIRQAITERTKFYMEQVAMSDDKYYNLTRGESEGMPTESNEVPYDRHNTKASGGHY